MNIDSIPFCIIRGGSSKGIYFNANDLPSDEQARNRVLLDIVGRDARQIDGLGGAHPLTSKVAIVDKCTDSTADIEYLFVQVVVGKDSVDTTPNCGNILAGVGVFAIESGLIKAQSQSTPIKVKMLNSDRNCELVMATPNGVLTHKGDVAIDGVAGTSAPVFCNYQDVQGAICGDLFPTGQVLDHIQGVDVTAIDCGMPVVILNADDFGLSGTESPDLLNEDQVLKAKLESIRLNIGPKMNLGDVSEKAVPKMCLVSKPLAGGVINTRTFIPHKCHTAIGVLGAVSVAAAVLTEGTVAKQQSAFADDKSPMADSGEMLKLVVEHPSGSFTTSMLLEKKASNSEKSIPNIIQAGVVRTARLLAKGEAYLP